jgi:hypothetical protein
MTGLPADLANLIGTALGLFFTLALLSYLIGDNPLYRLALHILIGVGVSYGALVVIFRVLSPRLVEPLSSGRPDLQLLTLVPLVLFIFLALKLSPRLAPLGNVGVAFMLGVGTAVAVAGALRGTLIPQVQATWLSLNPGAPNMLDSLVIIVGTITTLAYFQFWVQSPPTGGGERLLPMRWLAGVGKVFLVLTFGVIYAGLILSGAAVFSQRIAELWTFLASLIGRT